MTDLRLFLGHHVRVTGESGGAPFTAKCTVTQPAPNRFDLVGDAGECYRHIVCGPVVTWTVTDLPKETSNA